MKTLITLLLIALGVAGILYCRVNLGMSWDDMTMALENLFPRMLSIGIVLVGFLVTVVYVTRKDRT